MLRIWVLLSFIVCFRQQSLYYIPIINIKQTRDIPDLNENVNEADCAIYILLPYNLSVLPLLRILTPYKISQAQLDNVHFMKPTQFVKPYRCWVMYMQLNPVSLNQPPQSVLHLFGEYAFYYSILSTIFCFPLLLFLNLDPLENGGKTAEKYHKMGNKNAIIPGCR